MLSAWSVIWAAFAFVASAAPNHHGNVRQRLQKTTMSAIASPTDSSSGFDCWDKEDGAHGVGCDSSYWLCWRGVATSQDCPNDLMFNIENGQCDIADNVFACSGVRTTTALLSDNSPMPLVDFDCSQLEDGDYSFSDSSCQAKYVSCFAGAAWERTCPEGLSFDLENRVCKRIENIVACGEKHREHRRKPTDESVLIKIDKIVVIFFDCPTPTGSFAMPGLLCSSIFYNCNDSVVSIAICDDSMIWDNSSKQCRLPKDIPDCSFNCTGKPDATYSEGCSQNYWWCWEEEATKLACPDSMVFDADRVLCDVKENVVECGGVVPNNTVIASDNATPMPVDFDCSNVEDGQYAFKNGDVCQPKFVSCVDGVAWEMTCPDHLMFDPDLMMCDRIEAIVACGGTAEPITTDDDQTTLAAESTTPLAANPVSHQEMKTATLAADETTMLPSDSDDQTEATTLAAELITRRRPQHKTTIKALKTTTPLADDDTNMRPRFSLSTAATTRRPLPSPRLAAT